MTNDLREFLFRICCDMLQKASRYFDLKSDICDGAVTTKFKYQTVGDLGGIRFESVLEVKDQTIRSSFLIDPGMEFPVKDGVWVRADHLAIPTNEPDSLN